MGVSDFILVITFILFVTLLFVGYLWLLTLLANTLGFSEFYKNVLAVFAFLISIVFLFGELSER